MKQQLFFIAALLTMLISTHSFAQEAIISDPTITADVKNKISSNNSLKGNAINVTTTNGVVILTGDVDSSTQANTVTELAQETAGVRGVDTSKLMVQGSLHPMDDAMITAKVKGMYIQQKLLGNQDISPLTIKVETNNGVVSLSGTADNQEQANNAISIAKSISGVTEVKSNIKISHS